MSNEIFNPLTFLFDFFYRLVDLVEWLYSFLFTEIQIGSIKFTPIFAIGGGVIITIIIAKLVKEFVPLA